MHTSGSVDGRATTLAKAAALVCAAIALGLLVASLFAPASARANGKAQTVTISLPR